MKQAGSAKQRAVKPISMAGFTLIEIMVVLAIIGAIMVSVAPRLVDKKRDMRNAVQKIAILTREIHNAARLYNATYRLVIRMEENKLHTYSVESAPGNVTLLSQEQEEELEKSMSSDQEEEAKKTDFSEDARVLKGTAELPKGLFFGEIEYGNREDAISAGVAYIHFFPQGLTEEAVIHITDKKSLDWTIALHPITGRANLYERKMPLKELRSQ